MVSMRTLLTERSETEIVQRVQEIVEFDLFGFERVNLVRYLPYDHAKRFLQEGVAEGRFEQHAAHDPPLVEIQAHLPLAWAVANSRNGVVAHRNICHIISWLWLAGRDDLPESLRNRTFQQYFGKPALLVVSEEVEFVWRPHDDGQWVESNPKSGDAPVSVPTETILETYAHQWHV